MAQRMTDEHDALMAEFIADHNGGDAEDYLGDADTTRDPFDRYDGSHWREASDPETEDVGGYPARYFETVQAFKGQPRCSLYVVDFGEYRGIYQI